jgi:hypothetical protein
MQSSSKKTALVTGANKGIGLEMPDSWERPDLWSFLARETSLPVKRQQQSSALRISTFIP